MNIDNLNLIPYNDPILHQPCQKWDFTNPEFDIAVFAENLVKKMREARGIGLSANQVGIPYKIFSMETDPAIVVINPKIIAISDETIVLDEGCLSYPGLSVKVKRPRSVTARFNFPNGMAQTHTFTDITARCFLHEYDHIENGEVFINRANFFHKEKAEKNWTKILKNGRNNERKLG